MKQNVEAETVAGFYPGIMEEEIKKAKTKENLFNTHQKRKRRDTVRRLHELHRRTGGMRQISKNKKGN